MKRTKKRIAIQYLWMALFVILIRSVLQLVFGDHLLENVTSHLFGSLSLAAWVLTFGLLNLVVDFRNLFTKTPRFFKNFASALTIALSLIPAVTDTTIRVRNAARLRSHRRGFQLVRSIAIPVLSSAVDQALALADSMESRRDHKKFANSIHLSKVSFTYASGKPVLSELDFDVEPGTFTVVHGNTGCGKSTLLRVLHAKTPGSALVSQFPRETFVAETVFDEIAFAPRQQNKSKDEVQSIVTDLLTRFELNPKAMLLELSAGWQQRVAIAAALASGSNVLILDEPFSALDRAGSVLLLNTLEKLKAAGLTIVLAEHRTRDLLPLANEFFHLSGGNLKREKPKAERLRANHPTNGTVRVLLGENGSGKTTYLNELAKTRGVLVPQPASDLLFLDTVIAEFHQSDRDANAVPGSTKLLFKAFVNDCDELQNPRDLSEGQKLALAIAIQLAKETDFLMLDEPTLGFDTASRQNLVNQLSRIAATGVEILIATHDLEFAEAIATEVVPLEQVVNLAK